jgi:hypothetical protein
MATAKFPGNWFYHVTSKSILEPDESGKSNLESMVMACGADNDAEYIFQVLDECINHLMHSDIDTNEATNVIDTVYSSRNALDNKISDITKEIKKLKKKLDMYNYLYDAHTKQMRDLLMSLPVNQVVLADGTDIKLRSNPGKLVNERVPTPDDYKRFGDTFIRASYAWDLTKIKGALMDGEIDHTWVEKHGFEFIRDVSLTIKSLSKDSQ